MNLSMAEEGQDIIRRLHAMELERWEATRETGLNIREASDKDILNSLIHDNKGNLLQSLLSSLDAPLAFQEIATFNTDAINVNNNIAEFEYTVDCVHSDLGFENEIAQPINATKDNSNVIYSDSQSKIATLELTNQISIAQEQERIQKLSEAALGDNNNGINIKDIIHEYASVVRESTGELKNKRLKVKTDTEIDKKS